jgi:hypothetical protein
MLAAAVMVQAAGANKANKAKKKAGTVGLIEKVDAETKTITLKVSKKKDPNTPTKTIAYTDKTTVMTREGKNDEKAGTLADLAAGKKARVAVETKDGKEVATQITVVAKKKKDK